MSSLERSSWHAISRENVPVPAASSSAIEARAYWERVLIAAAGHSYSALATIIAETVFSLRPLRISWRTLRLKAFDPPRSQRTAAEFTKQSWLAFDITSAMVNISTLLNHIKR